MSGVARARAGSRSSGADEIAVVSSRALHVVVVASRPREHGQFAGTAKFCYSLELARYFRLCALAFLIYRYEHAER